MIIIFFHIGFEILSYDYSQLYNHLGHLVIDFLVVKDIIPSNVSTPHFSLPPPLKGIRVLGVPLSTSLFTSSFIKDVMLEDI